MQHPKWLHVCTPPSLHSDNMARVFTNNPERQAAGSDIEQLEEEADTFKSVQALVTQASHSVTHVSHVVT